MDTEKINFRCGFVTLIGRPNSGKSTLMNRLIGEKIAITSAKPQTTRNQIRTIYTDDEAQIIFVDTPGVHLAKNRLGSFMDNAARSALKDVDAVIFVTEAEGSPDDIETELLEEISKSAYNALLVLNKTDEHSAEDIEEAGKNYSRLLPNARVYTVSALRGEGTAALIDGIKKMLPLSEALYDDDELTDQPIRDIAAEIVREKALRLLDEEVPHGIAVNVNKLRERRLAGGGMITDIESDIICEKESHKGIIIGKGGRMIKKIGSLARADIEKLLDMKTNLQLFVKVRKDWRNDELQLKGLGYRDRK